MLNTFWEDERRCNKEAVEAKPKRPGLRFQIETEKKRIFYVKFI